MGGGLALGLSSIMTPCRAALIPPWFMNAVVALGSEQVDSSTPAAAPKWFTNGTGFFYGYRVDSDPDPSKGRYRTFLVTARHVVQSPIHLSVRVNPSDASAKGAELEIPQRGDRGQPLWFTLDDPVSDIAILPVDLARLRDSKFDIAFFQNDQHSAPKAKLRELGVSAGDGVFVLGFPMNLAGAERNFVIVRQGVVARMSEMLAGAAPGFLIDSFVFPGNSGGPVVLRPEIAAIEGTATLPRAYLAGIVVSYIPYRDIAVSQQTGEPRVMFGENSGLATVLPVDLIDATIRAWSALNVH